VPTGRCEECDKLVPIYARGPAAHPVHIVAGRALQFADIRQLAWYPVPHVTDKGVRCDGHKIQIGSTTAKSNKPKPAAAPPPPPAETEDKEPA
jgi:hypothetical protein